MQQKLEIRNEHTNSLLRSDRSYTRTIWNSFRLSGGRLSLFHNHLVRNKVKLFFGFVNVIQLRNTSFHHFFCVFLLFFIIFHLRRTRNLKKMPKIKTFIHHLYTCLVENTFFKEIIFIFCCLFSVLAFDLCLSNTYSLYFGTDQI